MVLKQLFCLEQARGYGNAAQRFFYRRRLLGESKLPVEKPAISKKRLFLQSGSTVTRRQTENRRGVRFRRFIFISRPFCSFHSLSCFPEKPRPVYSSPILFASQTGIHYRKSISILYSSAIHTYVTLCFLASFKNRALSFKTLSIVQPSSSKRFSMTPACFLISSK